MFVIVDRYFIYGTYMGHDWSADQVIEKHGGEESGTDCHLSVSNKEIDIHVNTYENIGSKFYVL